MSRKHIHILLIVAILTALISLGMFLFAFNAIKHKNQYASALSQTIQQRILEEENASELKKVISETKEKQEKLRSFIVDQEKIDEFATYIEAEGDRAGVPLTIRNVEIATVNPQILLMTLHGTGTFENIMHLVWFIENAPYKITIKDFSLNFNLESKWQVTMEIEVVSS